MMPKEKISIEKLKEIASYTSQERENQLKFGNLHLENSRRKAMNAARNVLADIASLIYNGFPYAKAEYVTVVNGEYDKIGLSYCMWRDVREFRTR
jgi:hypothetical protein